MNKLFSVVLAACIVSLLLAGSAFAAPGGAGAIKASQVIAFGCGCKQKCCKQDCCKPKCCKSKCCKSKCCESKCCKPKCAPCCKPKCCPSYEAPPCPCTHAHGDMQRDLVSRQHAG